MQLKRWPKQARKPILLISFVAFSLVIWTTPFTAITSTGSCETLVSDKDTNAVRNIKNVILPLKQMSSAFRWESPILLAGKPRNAKGLFTIGIPTVRRSKGSYLFSTLQSLVTQTQPGERLYTTIVICVNDDNATYASHLVKNITSTFSSYIGEGFIHVIAPPPSYYPSLSALKQTFGDGKLRVKWRSKQNLDYAFLMNYSVPLSSYYLQLEDDVLVDSGYIEKMKRYMKEIRIWTMLDFSTMGFIGKLYKNEDLSKLAYLLRTFYDEQPCDFLLNNFLSLMLQKRRYFRTPVLFLHMGKYSSLKNVIRNTQRDKLFSMDTDKCKKQKGDNPTALLYTTMPIYAGNELYMAYNSSIKNSYFWGKYPLTGTIMSIVFLIPQNITRVVIETGSCLDSTLDHINGAKLEYGKTISSGSGKIACNDYTYVDKFSDGRLVYNTSTLLNVKCLKITITENHTRWLIVRELAVFVTK